MILSYAKYGLRRAWALPIRSFCAILASAIAWLTLLHTVAEIASLKQDAQESGLLDGAQAYKVTVRQVMAADGSSRTTLFPRDLIEYLPQVSSIRVLGLRKSIFILRADHLRASTAEVVLYGISSVEKVTNFGDFPACSSTLSRDDWYEKNELVRLSSGWRCRAIDMPKSLKNLTAQNLAGNIFLPISAYQEIVGTKALDEVEVLWIGVVNAQKIAQLKILAQNKFNLELEISLLGQEKRGQINSLSVATQIWLYAAIGMLLLGLGLYVHGVFPAIRREAGLRASLGSSTLHMILWLSCDVMTQVFVLASLSYVLAIAFSAFRMNVFNCYDSLVLFLTINALMLPLFFCLAAYMASYWSCGRKLLTLLKD